MLSLLVAIILPFDPDSITLLRQQNSTSLYIFPNIVGANLKQFPHNAGVAMAVQIALLGLVAAIGIAIISQINITGLAQLSHIIFVLVVAEMLLFFFAYRSLLSKP